jgi:hypothetical protein
VNGYETRQRELQSPCAYLKEQRQEGVRLVEEPRPRRTQRTGKEKGDPETQRLVERGAEEVDATAPCCTKDL